MVQFQLSNVRSVNSLFYFSSVRFLLLHSPVFVFNKRWGRHPKDINFWKTIFLSVTGLKFWLRSSHFLCTLGEFKRSYRMGVLGEFHVPPPPPPPYFAKALSPCTIRNFLFLKLKILKPFYRSYLHLFENKQRHSNNSVKNFRDFDRCLEIFWKEMEGRQEEVVFKAVSWLGVRW